MSKKYILLFGGIGTLLAIAVIGYLFIKNSHQQPQNAVVKTMVKPPASSTGLSGNQTPVQSDNSSGLNIFSSNPSANPSTSGSTSPEASGGSTASQQTIDPTTFSQYEKYKDSQAALFGDIQVGNGAVIQPGQNTAVLYKGWLTNGQVFDQTHNDSTGKPAPFVFEYGAHQVITGWEQAMGGMKVGGTRLLIIPPAVGYGNTAQGTIPPNSVLIFEVQLLAAQ